jgi:hypothetical protein
VNQSLLVEILSLVLQFLPRLLFSFNLLSNLFITSACISM